VSAIAHCAHGVRAEVHIQPALTHSRLKRESGAKKKHELTPCITTLFKTRKWGARGEKEILVNNK
jgi:hypothetical protein